MIYILDSLQQKTLAIKMLSSLLQDRLYEIQPNKIKEPYRLLQNIRHLDYIL